jgi:hypothetical protein
MPGVQGAGRFMPAADAAELRRLDQEIVSSKSDETYEAWMRRTCAAAASIEVNINTGTYQSGTLCEPPIAHCLACQLGISS